MDIVVGVTGGIAAYKTVQLVRLLVKDGHEVHVVPTQDALRFVGTPTWEAISRHPVTTSVHEDVARVRHVALGQAADLVIVAPATANTLAKMAAGIADDLLGTTLLATTAPVVAAPAMHAEMWRHPATRANVEVLRERGVHLVGPEDGELTGGDSGPGRMTEPEDVRDAALRIVAEAAGAGVAGAADLSGLSVAVSAGGTREPIDPVRYLGNRSSGRQGVAIAVAAAERGALVRLVAANVAADVLAPATGNPLVRVTAVATAAELSEAMHAAAADADVLVMAAAVADYRPSQVAGRKITKESGPPPAIELVETEDVLAALSAARRHGQTVVGFAAETPDDHGEMLARARRKLVRKGADLLAANEVGWDRGFETERNAVTVVAEHGVVAEVTGTKREIAGALWDAVLDHRRGADAGPG